MAASTVVGPILLKSGVNSQASASLKPPAAATIRAQALPLLLTACVTGEDAFLASLSAPGGGHVVLLRAWLWRDTGSGGQYTITLENVADPADQPRGDYRPGHVAGVIAGHDQADFQVFECRSCGPDP